MFLVFSFSPVYIITHLTRFVKSPNGYFSDKKGGTKVERKDNKRTPLSVLPRFCGIMLTKGGYVYVPKKNNKINLRGA